ncbi:hypothetical protein [Kitasatospora sp. MAP5-34]|uniref:hypothetical protein n=1 Tax=Kitasatospora sp. MAP5-34 TaxID=3035102 RepID=UPI00247401DF|nr:hypothetical protein [Kitasatospora sp. MAP5-34]MDH6578391.1 hypothetical protein [Kitasatospora sp. MAP5-34]
MTVRRRSVVAVLGAALLLAGVTGCSGGSGGSGTSGGSPQPSPTASVTSPSPLATPTDRSPHGVLLSAQLAMHTARRAKFSYLLGADSGTGMLFWAPKTVLQLQRSGALDQLLVLDTTAYLGGDQATAARLGGRHWERYGAVPGGDIPYSGLVDRLNPVVAVTAAAAADSPELLGEEKLGDTAVQHYRVVTGVDAYVAAQTQLTVARRDALRASLGQGGLTELTLDLWLNDKDQLVQFRRTGTRTGTGATARLDDTVRYSEFAGLLSVQAPADTDTLDAGTQALPPFVP